MLSLVEKVFVLVLCVLCTSMLSLVEKVFVLMLCAVVYISFKIFIINIFIRLLLFVTKSNRY